VARIQQGILTFLMAVVVFAVERQLRRMLARSAGSG
jgi:hypothetical protein